MPASARSSESRPKPKFSAMRSAVRKPIEDVGGQAIGVLLDHFDGFVAVGLENLGGVARADPVGLQKEHDLADFFLVGPGLPDHLTTLFPDALDLRKSLDLLFDDVQSLFPEGFNDALGHDGADSLNQAGTQVFLDPGH